jgi:signal transduction histidine kinase
MFWGLFTHPILDSFTAWDTQLFWPLDIRLAFRSIFVIDPLYTLPFIIFLILAMRSEKGSKKRRKYNNLGLIISSAYLLLTLVLKGISYQKFENALEDERPDADWPEENGHTDNFDFVPPDAEVATHLYRIVQEAITNARKYAETDEMVIRVGRQDGGLVVEVEDDGVGFDASATETESLGLRSMQHRAELLGAELTIDSAPGKGTLVRCRLPARTATKSP